MKDCFPGHEALAESARNILNSCKTLNETEQSWTMLATINQVCRIRSSTLCSSFKVQHTLQPGRAYRLGCRRVFNTVSCSHTGVVFADTRSWTRHLKTWWCLSTRQWKVFVHVPQYRPRCPRLHMLRTSGTCPASITCA